MVISLTHFQNYAFRKLCWLFSKSIALFQISLQTPGQPNWEFWMLIFQCGNLSFCGHFDFMGNQFWLISRVNNCHFNICFEFWFFGNFTLENDKYIQTFIIQSCSYAQNDSIMGFKMTKIDFMWNMSGRRILVFPHCGFPIGLPRSVNHLISLQASPQDST